MGFLSLNIKLLKFVNQLIYLGSKITPIEGDVNTRIGKEWIAINELTISMIR